MDHGLKATLFYNHKKHVYPGTPYISRFVRLMPIVIILIYLSITVLLFAFGPWPWPIENGFKLYGFLAMAHLALLSGYLSTAFREPRGYRGKWSINNLLMMSLVLNLVLILPTSAFRSGSVLPNIARGLADPGAVYFASNAARAQASLIEYARILSGPFLFLLLPLTIFYWPRIRWSVRILSLMNTSIYLGIYVAIGTNKALADFILILPAMVVASCYAGITRISRRQFIIFLFIGVALFLLFISFFTSGQISRLGGEAAIAKSLPGGITADTNNFMVRDLKNKQELSVISLVSYLTQGYYGLSLALDEPFLPMFGIGNSMFLYLNAVKISGDETIRDMPYPVRVYKHQPWNPYGNWFSIYPWIASDVSFPGTLFVVFLIGRLFAMAWLDTLKGENPFAVAMLAILTIMLFYFPANNQVLQNGEALFGFYGLLAFWLFTRRRRVHKAK